MNDLGYRHLGYFHSRQCVYILQTWPGFHLFCGMPNFFQPSFIDIILVLLDFIYKVIKRRNFKNVLRKISKICFPQIIFIETYGKKFGKYILGKSKESSYLQVRSVGGGGGLNPKNFILHLLENCLSFMHFTMKEAIISLHISNYQYICSSVQCTYMHSLQKRWIESMTKSPWVKSSVH